jgi:hypothetical protein
MDFIQLVKHDSVVYPSNSNLDTIGEEQGNGKGSKRASSITNKDNKLNNTINIKDSGDLQ